MRASALADRHRADADARDRDAFGLRPQISSPDAVTLRSAGVRIETRRLDGEAGEDCPWTLEMPAENARPLLVRTGKSPLPSCMRISVGVVLCRRGPAASEAGDDLDAFHRVVCSSARSRYPHRACRRPARRARPGYPRRPPRRSPRSNESGFDASLVENIRSSAAPPSPRRGTRTDCPRPRSSPSSPARSCADRSAPGRRGCYTAVRSAWPGSCGRWRAGGDARGGLALPRHGRRRDSRGCHIWPSRCNRHGRGGKLSRMLLLVAWPLIGVLGSRAGSACRWSRPRRRRRGS